MTNQQRIARLRIVAAIALGVAGVAIGGAYAQSSVDEIAQYREALQDGNPAELWEARGEEMWTKPRGPKQVSFAACNLGLGDGVVKGAYAQLPRYFPDAARVMDLETRLVWCMVHQQGYTEADATKTKFGNGSAHRSDFEALAAYVTCHGDDGKRIRLQDLPNLTKLEGARKAYTTWPAYRVSQGEVRTFQWRLNDCFRQQRFPEPEFGSDASIALTAYLAGRANGAEYNGPAIKR